MAGQLHCRSTADALIRIMIAPTRNSSREESIRAKTELVDALVTLLGSDSADLEVLSNAVLVLSEVTAAYVTYPEGKQVLERMISHENIEKILANTALPAKSAPIVSNNATLLCNLLTLFNLIEVSL